MNNSTFSFFALALLASFSAIACAAPREEPTSDTSDTDIIGGIDAMNPEFDAVGYLVMQRPDGNSACTGTLISPTVVLTAKHCAMPDARREGSPTYLDLPGARVVFVVGQDPRQPRAIVEVKSIEVAPIFGGGYSSLGSDVALFTLKTPITNIQPYAVASAPPSAADVGTPFIAIGYGQQGGGLSGTRKIGALRLGAVTGAPLARAFASPEELLDWVQARTGAPLTPEQLESFRTYYFKPLADDYELYAGEAHFQGEVQICHGDSGGPLLRRENGKLVIHGVASTVVAPIDRCERGGIYATFGASTREMIARAIGDHCGPGADNRLVCGLAAEPTTCAMLDGHGSETTAPYVQCLATNCCSESTACFGDPECQALSNCFKGCATAGGDTAACANRCYAARSGSYPKYAAYQTCATKSCN